MRLIFALVFGIFATGAFADDESRAVVDRVDCAEIQALVAELELEAEYDDEVVEELAELKVEYRRSCTKKARGRRTLDENSPVVTEEAVEEVTIVEDEEVLYEQQETEDIEEEETRDDTPAVATISPEEELANLDAGLCADGSKPNKYGCCKGEIFKDLGDAVFACCPKGGEDADCYPPIK